MLFHEHADGGLYFKTGDANMKAPNGEWHDAVKYRSVGAPNCSDNVTARERWEDRFTPTYRRTSEEAENAAHPWFVLGLLLIITAAVGIMDMINHPPPEYRTGALVCLCAVGCAYAWGRWQKVKGEFDIRFRKPRR